MQEIIDLFKNFKLYKDMPLEDWNIIKEQFYPMFFKNRKYPRFFQSYLYLKSERKYFFYGFFKDCFILVKKKKEFGNRIFYLVLPPIHKEGNIEEELKIINELALVGIKTRVSDEDLVLYNLQKKTYKKNKDDIEMIYRPQDFKELAQEGFKKFRYNYKKLKKYEELKTIAINIKNQLDENDLKKNDELIENWNKYKKMHGDRCELYLNNDLKDYATYFEIINKDKKIITNSINEFVYKNKIVQCTNYLNYDFQIKDLQSIKALHVYMMLYWGNKLNWEEDIYFNSGSGGFDVSLSQHKRQLRPFKELQIYDTATTSKLTEEQYQLMCNG